MINQKYYNDIKNFPTQFKIGFDLSSALPKFENITNIVVCGMGGSALYIDLINDYLASKEYTIRIEPSRTYSLPSTVTKESLVILASHSGNTEESLEAANEALLRTQKIIVFSAGGKLTEFAQHNQLPLVIIPKGCQPRLSTGYFISALLNVLVQNELISSPQEEILSIANGLEENLNEDLAKEIAADMVNKVPLIYATDNNSSIARISKIKFNENAKIQSFWNYFPELNHNEMVGFTKLVMNPYFLILKSKFTHVRNHKRIDIFSRLMQEKNLPSKIIELTGDSVIAEILHAYYFVDHITYYLAQAYGIDPEPVDMVEDFKVFMEQ